MTGLPLVEFLAGQVLDAAWAQSLGRIFKKRLERARAILKEELERGTATLTDIEDTEEAAAMVFEYASAAERGTARRNLRMMAQALAGTLASPPIYADEFLRWSRIIADLTQTEIMTLAAFHKAYSVPESDLQPTDRQGPNVTRFQMTRDDLISKKVAEDENDVRATLQALGRYGLILQASGYGTLVYSPSKNLSKLMALVRIDDVLEEPAR